MQNYLGCGKQLHQKQIKNNQGLCPRSLEVENVLVFSNYIALLYRSLLANYYNVQTLMQTIQESGSAALGAMSEANVSCAAFSPQGCSEIAKQFPSTSQTAR